MGGTGGNVEGGLQSALGLSWGRQEAATHIYSVFMYSSSARLEAAGSSVP
jgi:hypothetical protein